MMPELKAKPDEILSHLRHITRRWSELDEDVRMEIVFLSCDDKAKVKGVTRFSYDAMGLEMAAEHVQAMNVHKLNAYVVVNPVRASSVLKAGTRASAPDIAASFFHWADADDAQAAQNIKNFVGPKCTFYVITGTQPCVRPHVYWELEEPTRNMEAWSATQRAIVATLKTDDSVVDPPRIMRIAGTINWPKPQKSEKGYIAEVTRLHIHTDDDREPVSSERMARAFQSAPKTVSPHAFDIDMGEHEGRSVAEYADILARARTDGQKHGGVRDLAAALAGMGVSRVAAEAIVKDACPVFDDNVVDLLDSAYQKFFKPKDVPLVQQAMQAEAAKVEADDTAFPTPYDFFDEETLQPRQWIYGKHYLRKFVSVLASAGGIGKTSMQIVEALAICTGRPLLGEAVVERSNVWLINLEDPMDEMQRRILAAMRHYGISPEEIRGRLFVNAGRDFSLTFAAQTREGVIPNTALVEHLKKRIPELGIGVTFIDPFVGSHAVNENDNMAVNFVFAQIRAVADETNSAIGIVHHVRKSNGEDANIDSVRGAGALIGAARAARVINRVSEDDAVKLGIDPRDAAGVFRVDDGKANMAPPARIAAFRKMEGVKIANGEWVGVATPFKLPDEWEGITPDIANEILRIIDLGIPDAEGNVEMYSSRPQDKDRWVGTVITTFAFDDPKDAKNAGQAKRIIAKWQEAGLLEEVNYQSARQRKERKGVQSCGRVGEQY